MARDSALISAGYFFVFSQTGEFVFCFVFFCGQLLEEVEVVGNQQGGNHMAHV
jgi:hypothetical protein